MPRSWHDRHAIKDMPEPEQDFYRSIVADKKPYFMRYIYPALMRQYNSYVKSSDKKCQREFTVSIDELLQAQESSLTERQREFIKYYKRGFPVGMNDCLMNKICRRIEKEFDGHLRKNSPAKEFDWHRLQSGSDINQGRYYAVKRLFEEYNRNLQNYKICTTYERGDTDQAGSDLEYINTEFRRLCAEACPNKEMLCDIVVDLCYRRSSTKKFAWEMCGDEIVQNILKNNGSVYQFPKKDDSGTISYCGNKYKIEEVVV